MPAQLTTLRQRAVRPSAVVTPPTPPRASRKTSATATPSTAPPRARRARLGERGGRVDRVDAAVVLDVEAGEHVVDATSGKSAATSAGPIARTSTPHLRLNAATRRNSSSRSREVASSMKPHGKKPVDWPVSASSLYAYSSFVYLRQPSTSRSSSPS